MKFLCLILGLLCNNIAKGQNKVNVDREMKFAENQLSIMLKQHQDTTMFPFSVDDNGNLKDRPSSWWCSGFFPGSLWFLYEYTQNPEWKKNARLWTDALIKEQFNKSTHDLGFMLYCSYGNAYRLFADTSDKNVLLNGAVSLASRYNPQSKLIKSWDSFEGYQFPVIIDNMMNLELLLWASKTSKDPRFRRISINHADQTLKNHFRKDNSCYHVVCYDQNGSVVAKKNHQGFADDSSWSRGQAWALYGYTVMYRETGKKKYLKQAEKIALFILKHPNMPKDLIPYWDYNAPEIPNEERDASAAAVTASALLELQEYSIKNQILYKKSAEIILESLSSETYKAALGTNQNFLLKHSVSAKTLGKEINKPLVYADYYYLEALLRYSKLFKN